jgi:hypothetical protein
LEREENFLDGSFASAKKEGTPQSAKPSAQILEMGVLIEGQGLALGIQLEGVSSRAAKLTEAIPDQVRIPKTTGCSRQASKLTITDRTYDLNPLRERPKEARHRIDGAPLTG